MSCPACAVLVDFVPISHSRPSSLLHLRARFTRCGPSFRTTLSKVVPASDTLPLPAGVAPSLTTFGPKKDRAVRRSLEAPISGAAWNQLAKEEARKEWGVTSDAVSLFLRSAGGGGTAPLRVVITGAPRPATLDGG